MEVSPTLNEDIKNYVNGKAMYNLNLNKKIQNEKSPTTVDAKTIKSLNVELKDLNDTLSKVEANEDTPISKVKIDNSALASGNFADISNNVQENLLNTLDTENYSIAERREALAKTLSVLNKYNNETRTPIKQKGGKPVVFDKTGFNTYEATDSISASDSTPAIVNSTGKFIYGNSDARLNLSERAVNKINNMIDKLDLNGDKLTTRSTNKDVAELINKNKDMAKEILQVLGYDGVLYGKQKTKLITATDNNDTVNIDKSFDKASKQLDEIMAAEKEGPSKESFIAKMQIAREMLGTETKNKPVKVGSKQLDTAKSTVKVKSDLNLDNKSITETKLDANQGDIKNKLISKYGQDFEEFEKNIVKGHNGEPVFISRHTSSENEVENIKTYEQSNDRYGWWYANSPTDDKFYNSSEANLFMNDLFDKSTVKMLKAKQGVYATISEEYLTPPTQDELKSMQENEGRFNYIEGYLTGKIFDISGDTLPFDVKSESDFKNIDFKNLEQSRRDKVTEIYTNLKNKYDINNKYTIDDFRKYLPLVDALKLDGYSGIVSDYNNGTKEIVIFDSSKFMPLKEYNRLKAMYGVEAYKSDFKDNNGKELIFNRFQTDIKNMNDNFDWNLSKSSHHTGMALAFTTADTYIKGKKAKDIGRYKLKPGTILISNTDEKIGDTIANKLNAIADKYAEGIPYVTSDTTYSELISNTNKLSEMIADITEDNNDGHKFFKEVYESLGTKGYINDIGSELEMAITTTDILQPIKNKQSTPKPIPKPTPIPTEVKVKVGDMEVKGNPELISVDTLQDIEKAFDEVSVHSKKSTKTLKNTFAKVYSAVFDRYSPILKKADLDVKNAVSEAWTIRNRVHNNVKVEQTDINGNVVGKALDTIKKQIKKQDLNDFQKTIRAILNVERINNDQEPVLNLNAKQSQKYYDMMLKKHPYFKNIIDDLRVWNTNNTQKLYDAGLINIKQKEVLDSKHVIYAPIYSAEPSDFNDIGEKSYNTRLLKILKI